MKMENKHKLNQCSNDWIMCICGNLFRDTKTESAKSKFISHLLDNGLLDLALYYEATIYKKVNIDTKPSES